MGGKSNPSYLPRHVCFLTFLIVATHIAERFKGSIASSFIPSLNHSPAESTSFTYRTAPGAQTNKPGREEPHTARAPDSASSACAQENSSPKGFSKKCLCWTQTFRPALPTPEAEHTSAAASKLTFRNKWGGASKCPSCFFVRSARDHGTGYSQA